MAVVPTGNIVYQDAVGIVVKADTVVLVRVGSVIYQIVPVRIAGVNSVRVF
jgi:hypothetical protein